MKVRIRLFAVARELAGADALEVDLPESATVREAAMALAEKSPELQRVLEQSFLAVDGEFAPPDLVVPPGAEVALIPPVSGG